MSASNGMNKNFTTLIGILVAVIVLNVVWLNVSVLGISKKSSEVAAAPVQNQSLTGAFGMTKTTVAGSIGVGQYDGGSSHGSIATIKFKGGKATYYCSGDPSCVAQFGSLNSDGKYVDSGSHPVGTWVKFLNCTLVSPAGSPAIYNCEKKEYVGSLRPPGTSSGNNIQPLQ